MNNENELKERLDNLVKRGRVLRNFENFKIHERREENESPEYLIEGIACVFDNPTVLFEYDGVEYKEVVSRDAFNDADINDVIFNYNHGGRVYARTRNDSLHLEVKEDGLHVRLSLDPNDEGHMQLYRDIKKGLIDKMSYAYTVPVDGEEYDSETHTCTVLKIKKLYDVSAVDIPAYDSTSISARAFIDLDKSLKEKLDSDASKKRNVVQRKNIAEAIKLEMNLENLKNKKKEGKEE